MFEATFAGTEPTSGVIPVEADRVETNWCCSQQDKQVVEAANEDLLLRFSVFYRRSAWSLCSTVISEEGSRVK